MDTLATSTPADLPGCGEPATIQIEFYTARDGHAHGSLDGVLRMCDRHATDIDEVVSWDTSDPKPTIYRKAITRPGVRCGSGYDFVAGAAIEPSGTGQRAVVAGDSKKGVHAVDAPSTTAEGVSQIDDLGDERPIVGEGVQALRAFGDLTRADAARLLPMWTYYCELGAEERDAVLARFPEGDEPTETVEDDEPYTFSTMVEAYRLGELAGHHKTDEDMALVARLDKRLKDAETAYDRGYTDGLSAAYDDPTQHAFTVRAIDDGEKADFLWQCRCGWDDVQFAREPLAVYRETLLAHLAEAGER